MDFIRARNNEQKDIRIKQIIDAALTLYETETYDNITMASIARELNFSRANLYKYIATKEEIFLLIISEDLDAFIQDIVGTFENQGIIGVSDFTLKWAQTLFHHERLLQLFSILSTVIEKKVSVKPLALFKDRLFKSIMKLYPIVKKQIPSISDDQIMLFLTYQLHYAVGFYPSTTHSDVQREALKLIHSFYIVEDFVPAFSEFLTTIIKGICNED